MKINTLVLKEDINNLNTLIDKFKELYTNMYNEFSNCATYWNDPNAIAYFKSVQQEKSKVNKAITDMSSLKDLYQYILESYSTLGKVLEIDLNYKERIIKSLEEYIERLRNIIRSYDSIDTYELDEVNNYIKIEKKKLNDNLELLSNYLSNVRKLYSRVEQLEIEVKAKVANVKVSSIIKNTLNK